ncbi:MAG: arsenite-activated ATPase (arsA) [halophilic archaeon J07HX64]|nr:MAG: arsenite-activated ATPase (arsA) [halophilic archaeon J07HX64]
MTEFVLFGGKGGVGKTTLAAASGLVSAREGARTLVVSTDPAHSIGDAYERSVRETPTRVTDEANLYALEIDPRSRFRERYGDTFESVISDVQSLGVDLSSDDVGAVSEEGLVPGADEVAVLDLFAEYNDHDNWEVVVFDTAPTGHTLRLLQLPDVMNTTLGRVLALRDQFSSVTSTVGSLLGRGDDSPSYSDQADQLEHLTEEVGERLRDDDRTTFRAVTLAERMSLEETDRLLAELESNEITVDGVLVNKLLQDASEDCPTCWPRYQEQLKLLAEARDRFDLPVREVPLVADQRGLDRVEAVTEFVDGA